MKPEKNLKPVSVDWFRPISHVHGTDFGHNSGNTITLSQPWRTSISGLLVRYPWSAISNRAWYRNLWHRWRYLDSSDIGMTIISPTHFSDIGITDINVGCRKSVTLGSMSMPTYRMLTSDHWKILYEKNSGKLENTSLKAGLNRGRRGWYVTGART
jgi:hypothetical protein